MTAWQVNSSTAAASEHYIIIGIQDVDDRKRRELDHEAESRTYTEIVHEYVGRTAKERSSSYDSTSDMRMQDVFERADKLMYADKERCKKSIG